MDPKIIDELSDILLSISDVNDFVKRTVQGMLNEASRGIESDSFGNLHAAQVKKPVKKGKK